jgi:predicted nucleotidyltransferase
MQSFRDGNQRKKDLMHAVAGAIKVKYQAMSVILYGSWARGEETEDSDIDLFVVADTDDPPFKRQAAVRRLLRNFRKHAPFSPLVVTPRELQQRQRVHDQFIEEILEEGIEL